MRVLYVDAVLVLGSNWLMIFNFKYIFMGVTLKFSEPGLKNIS